MAQHIAKLTHGGTEFRRGRTVQEPIAGKRHFLGEWIQIDKIAKVLLADSRIQRGKTLQCDQIRSSPNFPKRAEGSPVIVMLLGLRALAESASLLPGAVVS